MMPVFDSVQEAQDFYERKLAQRDEELRELIERMREDSNDTELTTQTQYAAKSYADELEAILNE